MNTCKTCKHWKIKVLAKGWDWGDCQVIAPTSDSEREIKAFTESRPLDCREDFGCNLHEIEKP